MSGIVSRSEQVENHDGGDVRAAGVNSRQTICNTHVDGIAEATADSDNEIPPHGDDENVGLSDIPSVPRTLEIVGIDSVLIIRSTWHITFFAGSVRFTAVF